VGGAAFVTHAINYNNWLPTIAARYRIWRQWSAYAEFSEGSVIPVSAVFDVPGANVLVPPKPTTAKTYQIGSVLKLNRFTLDMDAYYVHFQNGYDTYTDPTANEPISIATGPTNTRGVEAEGNYAFGHGLSLYGNFTAGSAKYQTGPNYPNGGLWVANTPRDVEGMSLLYQHGNYDFGLTWKRVGQYYNDNGSLNYTINGIKGLAFPVNQAITINAWDLVNVFANYTVKNSSHFRGTKIQLAVNNLANAHNIVGITAATAATAAAAYVPSQADQLNLMPGRSISLTITGGYAPRR
jgi:iron complex outermembrane receptor protein